MTPAARRAHAALSAAGYVPSYTPSNQDGDEALWLSPDHAVQISGSVYIPQLYGHEPNGDLFCVDGRPTRDPVEAAVAALALRG